MSNLGSKVILYFIFLLVKRCKIFILNDNKQCHVSLQDYQVDLYLRQHWHDPRLNHSEITQVLKAFMWDNNNRQNTQYSWIAWCTRYIHIYVPKYFRMQMDVPKHRTHLHLEISWHSSNDKDIWQQWECKILWPK